MAAVASARPTPSTPSVTKPSPSPLHTTSVNGTAAPAPTTTSNNSANTRPASAAPSKPAVEASANGVNTRARPRPRLSNARPHEKPSVNGDSSRRSTIDRPLVTTTEDIIRKFDGKPPSLVLHLYPTYFRFDQQDGTFGYNSPMRMILDHIKQQTVPHDILEELLRGNVPFYDGCLIVNIHDHMSAGKFGDSSLPGGVDASGQKKFSVHNYNRFITPSPYKPFPKEADSTTERPGSSAESLGKEDSSKAAPGSKAPPKKPSMYTVVLHPTPQSIQKEINILANLPASDNRQGKRSSVGSRDNSNALSTIPTTPLSAVPSTPAPGSKQPPAKKQRMMLEEHDIHDFEAAVLLKTNPVLQLDPVSTFEEAQAMLESRKDPLHDQPRLRSKARKRTHAELAADEAQAAEAERIALIMDERLEPSISIGGAPNADEGGKAQFQPDFARFKILEEIKRNHEEEKKREVLANAAKREANEAEKRRQQLEAQQREQQQQQEALRQQQQTQQTQQTQQHQNQQQQHQSMLRQQQLNLAAHQQQQQQQRPQATPQQQRPVGQGSPLNPQMANAMQSQAQSFMQQQGISQGQQASPIPGAHAPMQSSPLAGNMFNQPTTQQQTPGGMQAVSNAGSPPRPGSAMPAPQPMARGPSKQSQHSVSRTSTPQMPNATPQMANRGTPQPQFPTGMQNAALAAKLQSLPPEQRQALFLQQQASRKQALAQAQMQAQGQGHAQMMMGSPGMPMMSSPHPDQMGGNQVSPQHQRMPGSQQGLPQGITPERIQEVQRQQALQQRQIQHQQQLAMAQRAAQQQQMQRQQSFNAGQGQGQQMSPRSQQPGMAANMSRNPSQMMHPQMSQQGSQQTMPSPHNQNQQQNQQAMQQGMQSGLSQAMQQGMQQALQGQQQGAQQGQLQGQQGPMNMNNLTPQQQQILLKQQQFQQQQMLQRQQQQQQQQQMANMGGQNPQIKQRFFASLQAKNGGTLPPNAEQMWAEWVRNERAKQQAAYQQRMRQQQLQGQGQGQGQGQNQGQGGMQNGQGMNMGGGNGGGGGGGMNGNIVPASTNQQAANMMQPGQGLQNPHMQAYNANLHQQQQRQKFLHAQQQQQQNGMGMNNGNNMGMMMANLNAMNGMGGMGMNGMGNMGNMNGMGGSGGPANS